MYQINPNPNEVQNRLAISATTIMSKTANSEQPPNYNELIKQPVFQDSVSSAFNN
jgi:hypothetical protein